jgi:hypothetical protein
LAKTRGTYPHLAQSYSYGYCLRQYEAHLKAALEVHQEKSGWNDLVEKKKRSGIEVRTRIVSGKCLDVLKSEVTPEDIEKIVRFIRANYITLDDLYAYCEMKIPPEHF